MKNSLSLLLIILTLFGCSSNVNKNQYEDSNRIDNNSNRKRIATEKFINGSILEQKGKYAEAVIEYLDALKFDQQPGIYYALAKNYYSLNKLSSAIQFAKKSIELESKNIEYLYLLASLYSSAQLPDSSVNVYERIVKLDSSDVKAYFQLAVLNESKRPSKSIDYYKKILNIIGPEWTVLVRLVDLNERMGNINETIKTVEQLSKLNPSDIQLIKVLIDSYIKNKEFEKALKLAEDSLISFPDDLGLVELKANIFLSQQKWKDAANEFMKLINSSEIDFENKLKIGTLFYAAAEKDSSNFEFAKQILNKIDKDTSDWQVNAYLGEIELSQKNDSSAINYFKKAASLAEWNSQIWIRLGGTLFDTRKYNDAIHLMKPAVEKFPNDFAINLIYGLSLAQENKHDAARIFLSKAYNINPNDLTVLSALGYSLNQLKLSDDALNYLDKALRIDPDNIQIISIAAMIYENKKSFVISDSLYNHALSLDSTNALILNNYAYSLSERNIHLDEALRMAQIALDAEPENSSYLDTIGWIFFQLGDYNKAKKYIEESIKIDQKSGTVFDHLGDIYFKLDDKKNALLNWKKALELEPDNKKYEEKIEKGEL